MGAKLTALGVAGAERVRSLNDELAEVLLSDASDAPERLGGETSALYENLKWAREVSKALDNGLEETIRQLQDYCREINTLPEAGVTGELRQALAAEIELRSQRLQTADFYHHSADFSTFLTSLQTAVRDTVSRLAEQQQRRLTEGLEDLKRLPDWQALNQETQQNISDTLDNLFKEPAEGIRGLRQLLGREYTLNHAISEQKAKIQQIAKERRVKEKEERIIKGKSFKDPITLTRSVSIPPKVTSRQQLEQLLETLEALKADLDKYQAIDISLEIQE